MISRHDKLKQQIARIIIGPRFPLPNMSREEIEHLRDIKWNAASTFERNDARTNAEAILREMHVFPMSESTRKSKPDLRLVKKTEK